MARACRVHKLNTAVRCSKRVRVYVSVSVYANVCKKEKVENVWISVCVCVRERERVSERGDCEDEGIKAAQRRQSAGIGIGYEYRISGMTSDCGSGENNPPDDHKLNL